MLSHPVTLALALVLASVLPPLVCGCAGSDEPRNGAGNSGVDAGSGPDAAEGGEVGGDAQAGSDAAPGADAGGGADAGDGGIPSWASPMPPPGTHLCAQGNLDTASLTQGCNGPPPDPNAPPPFPSACGNLAMGAGSWQVWCSASGVYFYAWIPSLQIAQPGQCDITLPDGGMIGPLTQPYAVYAADVFMTNGVEGKGGAPVSPLRSYSTQRGLEVDLDGDPVDIAVDDAESFGNGMSQHGSGGFYLTARRITCNGAGPDPNSQETTFGIIDFQW